MKTTKEKVEDILFRPQSNIRYEHKDLDGEIIRLRQAVITLAEEIDKNEIMML